MNYFLTMQAAINFYGREYSAVELSKLEGDNFKIGELPKPPKGYKFFSTSNAATFQLFPA